MSQETLKIIEYHPARGYIHALALNGEKKPIRTTYFSGKEITLFDEDDEPIRTFYLDDNPKQQSYEVILAEAYRLNERKDYKIIDETIKPTKDITSKF